MEIDSPSMHILALQATPEINILGLATDTSRLIFIPAVTTDGRISLLSGGVQDDFYKLQQAVASKIAQRMEELHWSTITLDNVAVVAVNMFRGQYPPTTTYFIFQALVLEKPMPELSVIYHLINDSRVGNDDVQSKAQLSLNTEPTKQWINNAIGDWKLKLNWTQYVENEYSRMLKDI